MSMRVFTSYIKFMMMVRMLYRSNRNPTSSEFFYQVDDQRCFSVVLPAYDVQSFHHA